jgi:hypothetical protein
VKETLEEVLEKINEALGEYAPVTETHWPEWALSLKEAQGKIIEEIEEIDIGGDSAQLEKLWQEFISWDNGESGTDGSAERYAKYKGAGDYKTIAFMAFVKGRSISEKVQDETGN